MAIVCYSSIDQFSLFLRFGLVVSYCLTLLTDFGFWCSCCYCYFGIAVSYVGCLVTCRNKELCGVWVFMSLGSLVALVSFYCLVPDRGMFCVFWSMLVCMLVCVVFDYYLIMVLL